MKRAQRNRRTKRNARTTQKEPLAEGIIPLRKNGQRHWASMNDDEIVSYAKRVMKENGITGRKELRGADGGLHYVLRIRKLLNKVGFEEKRRLWSAMGHNELVSQAKKVMKERGMSRRYELAKVNQRLYDALRRRKLLDKIGFEGKRRKKRLWTSMSDEEIVSYAKKSMKENGVRGIRKLQKVDGGLYEALRKRKLLDKVEFEKKQRPGGFFTKMKDKELVEYAKRVMKKKGIKDRKELRKVDNGLYDAMGRRKLLDKMGFERKRGKSRQWRNINDDKLVRYAKRYVKDNNIRKRGELYVLDQGLYQILRRRKLVDRLFSDIEKAKQRRADDEVIRVLEEFGGAE